MYNAVLLRTVRSDFPASSIFIILDVTCEAIMVQDGTI